MSTNYAAQSELYLFAEIISDKDFRRDAVVVEYAIMARHARAINALLRAPPLYPYRRHAAVVIVLFGFNYSSL